MNEAIIFLTILFAFYNWGVKIHFLSKRKGKDKIKAIVVDYHLLTPPTSDPNEIVSKMAYPFVKIIGKDEGLIKLRYTRSYYPLPFRVGEEIDVFWFAGDLLYWDAYDIGIYKYFPSSLLFWRDSSSRKID